jgi:hypothetical protein
MAMAFKQFHDSFWDDPTVRKLSTKHKLLFAYFFTNRQAHYSGLYHFDVELIPKATGLSLEEVREGIDTLSVGYSRLKVDWENEIVWVINMLKRQTNSKTKKLSATQIAGIHNHLNTLHNSPLIEEFYTLYDTLSHTPSIPHPDPIPYPTGNKNKNKNKNKTKDKRSLPYNEPPAPSPMEAGAGDDLAILKVFLKEKAEPDCENCHAEGYTYQTSSITKGQFAVQCPCTNDAAMTPEDVKRIQNEM